MVGADEVETRLRIDPASSGRLGFSGSPEMRRRYPPILNLSLSSFRLCWLLLFPSSPSGLVVRRRAAANTAATQLLPFLSLAVTSGRAGLPSRTVQCYTLEMATVTRMLGDHTF